MRLPEPPILVITDRRQARRPLEAVAEAVFEAGGRWLSLREKDLDPAARRSLLARLVALGRRYGAAVTVHEDVAAAIAAGAAGVHLPAGVSPQAARQALGAGALIGCSAHVEAELASLAAAGADYATLSPIFASASKPGYGPALGCERLARAAAATRLGVVALGGVAAGNVAACIAAGAVGIAVMGSVMSAAAPAAVMADLITALAQALAARRDRAP
ncbi:MAG TPA: thiamine phosphate synthase [Stellaceae bacterium]|nr:thiamine phosphate synthase [Stellaceae bacterium]